ncbi:MAG: hypothetical protein CMJ13_04990 [Pelagibacterales bacterium]|nr:hypothetical protein [Pelagibacterales bacterium]
MNKNTENFIVRVEGGLGAQIVAVSAYFFLKKIGCRALLDLGYFEYPYRKAVIGKPQVTHWDWKLDYYGLSESNLDWINLNKLRKYSKENLHDSNEGLEMFDLNTALENFFKAEGKEFNEYHINDRDFYNTDNIKNVFIDKPVIIHDGPNKNRLFINAMLDKSIKEKFCTNSEEWKTIVKTNNIDFQNTIFLHLRRGDYLNVATHLISTNDIIKICRKLPKVLKNIVVFSDANEIDNQKFISELKLIFNEVKWMDDIDNVNTHKIMSEASFLMCSNSQFSTTAAYLSNGFSIIPQKYSSDNDYVFQYENRQTSFALLNN